MASATLSMTYEGQAVEDGQMDVALVAPALLGLAELVAAVSAEVYPDRDPLRLSVTATREGSFAMDLAMSAGGAVQQLVDVFSGDTAEALTSIQALIFGGTMSGAGLLKFLLWLRKRRIAAVEPTGDGGVTIVLNDNATLVVDARTMELASNDRVRRGLDGVLAPLAADGIEHVDLAASEVEVVRIDSRAAEYLRADDFAPEDLGSHEVEKWVTVVGVNFEDRTTWRFDDGSAQFPAKVLDEAFLDRVARREIMFAKGDTLRCWIRVTQHRSRRGIESRYEVLEVYEVSRPLTLELPDDDDV